MSDAGLKNLSETNFGAKTEQNAGLTQGSVYENILARELHDNFNNDIVRHASMILKDEGKGLIRLALKPESLGNVKIRLEMAENKITGQIIVESEEALNAFKKEVHSLEQAFRDSGFQDANLEMTLAGDRDGAGQFWQWEQARTMLPESETASRYDSFEQSETFLFNVFEQGKKTINMLV